MAGVAPPGEWGSPGGVAGGARGVDLAALDSSPHGAAEIAEVTAVVESAVIEMPSEFEKAARQGSRILEGRRVAADSRRVDQLTATGQPMQHGG